MLSHAEACSSCTLHLAKAVTAVLSRDLGTLAHLEQSLRVHGISKKMLIDAVACSIDSGQGTITWMALIVSPRGVSISLSFRSSTACSLSPCWARSASSSASRSASLSAWCCRLFWAFVGCFCATHTQLQTSVFGQARYGLFPFCDTED